MEIPAPPELEGGDVPFEPRRSVRVRSEAKSTGRNRKPLVSITVISGFLLLYAIGAAAVGYEGTDLLLFAWLMIGPLAIAIYMAREAKKSVVNPYTLFFVALIGVTVVIDILHRGK